MTMNQKTIVIIGAGVGGLTAGIYAEQNGFHAIILEKNPSVGGLCTGWYRQGRYIDGCLHWLTGTNEGNDLNEMWKNVGAIDEDTKILQLDSWGHFDYQGQKVVFWRDLERAEKEWKEISPIDSKQIHKFFNMVKDIMTVDLPLSAPASMLGFKKTMKLGFDVINVWPSYLLSMRMSCEKYAKRFKSPAIRWALTHVQPGAGNLYSMAFCYATVASGNGGLPEGGSKPLVERMKTRFESLGGTLKLNSDVLRVLVRKRKVVGVILKDGTRYYGDYVVSALDANYTMGHILLKQYKINKLDKRFNDMKKHPAPSCCLLAFEGNDTDIPAPYSFECEPFYVGGELISHLTIRNYNYDRETFVKNGKTIYSVLIDQYSTNYSYWNDLYKNNPKEYRKKKEELAQAVLGRIVAKFPQLKGNLKILDVSTPKTLNRYTNASRGAYMGFLFNHRSNMFTHSGFVPGLRNFLMAGQWMQCPGGLPLALAEGKFAIQRICKIEKLSYAFSGAKVYAKKNAN